jgi:hypothetical protein
MTAPTGANAALERQRRQHKSTDRAASQSNATHPLLRLQKQAGNAAVARLLQRVSESAVQRAQEEPDEEELAQASHDPTLQRQADEDEEMVMGDHDDGAHSGTVGLGGGPLQSEAANLIDSMRGAGSHLSENVRAAAEPALGVDLAGVRVHQDGASDSLARGMTARAFTTGSDIFLRSDANANDPRLMTHELTHVLQQSEGIAGAASGQRMTVGAADDPLEAEADQVAEGIASGAPANREFEER